MTLEQRPLKPFPAGQTAAKAEAETHGIRPAARGLPLLMAAEGADAGDAHPTHFFNGKLEAPRLFARIAEAAEIASVILIVVALASVFAWASSTLGTFDRLAHVMVGAGAPEIAVLLGITALLLVAGMFLDAISIYFIFLPLLVPIAKNLGIDPIHLGVIMTVNMEIGMIHPPVGLNLFVASHIAKMGLTEVSIACLPWVFVLLAYLMLITYVPAVSLWLPNLLY